MTHVCRHWREAALASPTIWASSTWDTSNEMPSEWIERLTSRSASMPISLDVSNHEDPCIVANRIALLRRNISRIAQLCVIDKLFSCSILPAIFPILAEPAPCLQHLYIFTSSTQRQEKLRLIPPFHQSTSHLKVIRTENCWLSGLHPSSRAFIHVTYLAIESYSESLTLHDLHAALSIMPSLRYLVIRPHIYSPANESLENFAHISLSRLRSVTLSITPQALTTFLHFSTLPNVASFQVSINCEVPFTSALDEALSVLVSRHSHIPALSRPYDSLQVHEHVGWPADFEVKTDDDHFMIKLHITDPTIHEPSRAHAEHALISILTKVPITHQVQKLSGLLRPKTLGRPHVWSRVCVRMSSLKDVSGLQCWNRDDYYYGDTSEVTKAIQKAALRAGRRGF